MLNCSKPKTLALLVASALSMLAMGSAQAETHIGGSLKVNYAYKEFSESSKSKGGDLDFNSFELKVKSEWDDVGMKAAYRFMNGHDYLKFGYAYYNGLPDWQFQAGIINKPFGNRKYASHNWWYSLNYYLGFEDDFDMGVKAQYSQGGWISEMAFFKNSEYKATDARGFAADAARMTINGTDYHNEETNTFNLRQSYGFDTGGISHLVGASLEYGQLYDTKLDDNGTSTAYAVHWDSRYNGYNMQLQFVDYDYDQANQRSTYGVKMLNSAFEVASAGQVYTFNLAKSFKRDWGSFTIYNDYSMVEPDTADANQDRSVLNSTGVSISVKQFQIYIDHYMAKNSVWLGDKGIGLADGDDDWNHRINVNLAYKF
ncbi:hypothetical protein [Ferrimonas sp. YFM]|uniref:hypothetical protein n=1 Tax=Ferrimonas sp. YFM TaxID=3028878 RepID=UPI0025736A43|nr:hypothetical protein [Ferrimonas sp. YFM]BDY06773.1 outer membrane beta barrel protein [Ferrimonas sp. YFM]